MRKNDIFTKKKKGRKNDICKLIARNDHVTFTVYIIFFSSCVFFFLTGFQAVFIECFYIYYSIKKLDSERTKCFVRYVYGNAFIYLMNEFFYISFMNWATKFGNHYDYRE